MTAVPLNTLDDALNKVGDEMVAAAPEGWTHLTLHLTGAGSMVKTRFVATTPDGEQQLGMPMSATIACDELRASMASDGGGTWYNATVTVDQDETLDADFDYDGKPFDGDPDDKLLLEDQELYPRAPEHLPDWHPAHA